MISMQLKGVKEVLANFTLADKRVKAGAEIGLVKGGQHLVRESMKIVPVDKGNLRASVFIRKFGFGTKTDVQVGYTAKYAVYVHEMLDRLHGLAYNIKYAAQIATGKMHDRGPNQQAKFLEKPMKIERSAILGIVRNEIKKKMKI